MSHEFQGKVIIKNANEKPTIELHGDVSVMRVLNNEGRLRYEFAADGSRMHILDNNGNGSISVEGNKRLLAFINNNVFPTSGIELDWNQPIMRIRNNNGKEAIALNGALRRIAIRNEKENLGVEMDGSLPFIRLLSSKGNFAVELDGNSPIIRVFNNDTQKEAIALNGGANDIGVRNANGDLTILLDGKRGDIELLNADCAEEFDILPQEVVEPGTVMVINDNGILEPNREAYDKRVAGIISGAGDKRPGIVLDKQNKQGCRMPVALMGKVLCKIDAEHSPIEIGDMLTTSSTLGHAMKATDPQRSFGAVIGKALGKRREGKGLIPILVALQ